MPNHIIRFYKYGFIYLNIHMNCIIFHSKTLNFNNSVQSITKFVNFFIRKQIASYDIKVIITVSFSYVSYQIF